MGMTKVVIINQSTGYLMIDIANAYADEYDEVVLMAGSIKVAERHLNEKIRVDKIIAYNRTSSMKRLLTWLWASIQIFNRILFKYRNYEVVYVTNPPMAYLSSLLLKNPFSIIIYDTYPDALKNIGIGKDNVIYKWWGKKNKLLFARASKIVTLSNGMADCLANYVSREKIRVVPNWSSKSNFKPLAKSDNPFAKSHGVENKFTVLYSGNMGFTHNVETIVEVAKRLSSDEQIHFMLIGDGKKKVELQKRCREYGLNNCTFLDWQPVDVMPYSLACADLGVITLNDETALVSVPSKTYNLLAVGAPLMVIAPQESEIARMVEQFGNGKCFAPGDVGAMAAFVKELSSNSTYRQQMSDNSVEASKNFTYANARLYVD